MPLRGVNFARRSGVNIESRLTTNRPTAAHGKVTVNEDTSYTFGAGDFGFSGVNAGDTLASVKIVTLPSDGALELDGAAVMAGASVTKADIDADNLVFAPGANGNGAPYASFTFKVNDGTRDSLSAYRMAIEVTPASDAATGRPTVTGKAQVGHTLIADIGGIVDVDGLPPGFTYQWIHVAGELEANIPGATSRTYKLTADDAGKTVKVKVSFTDLGGGAESATSEATAEVAATATACNAPDFGTRTPIWSGTVTVETWFDFYVGYSTLLEFGELENKRFRVGSDEYVVPSVFVHGSASPSTGRLDFSVNPALRSHITKGWACTACLRCVVSVRRCWYERRLLLVQCGPQLVVRLRAHRLSERSGEHTRDRRPDGFRCSGGRRDADCVSRCH